MGCIFAKVNNNYKLGSKYKIRRNFILQDSEQYGERCSMENVKDDSQSVMTSRLYQVINLYLHSVLSELQ